MRFNRLVNANMPAKSEDPTTTAEYRLYQWAANYSGNNLSISEADNLLGLLPLCDYSYIAKLCLFCKNELNRRTAPLLLLAMLAASGRNKEIFSKRGERSPAASIRQLVPQLVQRPDEIPELLSMCSATRGGPVEVAGRKKTMVKIPKSVMRGVADIFESGKFSEYQYSKWDRGGNITLRDALFMCRPKPQNPEQVALFAKIANRMLSPAETHERQIGMIQQSGLSAEEIRQAKVVEWNRLIDEKKISHIALIREMKHICQLKDGGLTLKAIQELERTSEKSTVLPYQYIAMLTEISKEFPIGPAFVSMLDRTVLRIMGKSISNHLKIFGEKVALCVDYSTSMYAPLNSKSSMIRLDAALSYAVPFLFANEGSNVVLFGVNAVSVPYSGDGSYLGYARYLEKIGVDRFGTNVGAAFIELMRKGGTADTILIITDMEFNHNVSEINDIVKQWGKRVVFLNLVENTYSPVKIEGDVAFISGLNPLNLKLYEYMKEGKSVVDVIKGLYWEDSKPSRES